MTMLGKILYAALATSVIAILHVLLHEMACYKGWGTRQLCPTYYEDQFKAGYNAAFEQMQLSPPAHFPSDL